MLTHPAKRVLASAVLFALAGDTLAAPMLEEIVVTAQKREQSLQDIPIAITALDSGALERRRITKITDISNFAPNVEIVDSPTNTTAATIAIRGASQINPAITWENSVGIYLDGVFIGKNIGAVFDIAELERVEVLRGPQGTLYGKNTVGGALNLITRKPAEEFGGKVTAEFGNEGYWSGRASVDTGEWMGLKSTLTLYKAERDGFADNVPDQIGNPLAAPPSSDEFQSLDSEAARVALLWDANDSLSVGYTYDYSDQNNKPRFGQLTQVSPNSFLYAGGIQEAYLTNDDERADKGSNDWAFEESSESQSHALDVSWRGENMTLRSITSYRDLQWDDLIDIDGTAVDLFHSGRGIDYESWSQEFQLSGQYDQLDYVVGLYYFQEEGDVFNPITFFGSFGTPTANNRYGMDNESIAAFGQADWRPGSFNDRLTLSFGLRWTEEDKDQYIDQPGNYAAQTDDTFDNISPSLAVSWAFTDDVSAYARYALGWKSGGFNGEAADPTEFFAGYDDEEVSAYELGVKSLLMEGRLQLNAAVFYNDFEDFQLSVFEGQNASSVVFNIPRYENQGLEIEAVALVSEDVQLSLAYGYLDAEYKKFPVGLDAFTKDEAGIPYTPENNLTLGVDWTLARASYGTWSLNVDYSYLDDHVPYIDPDQNAASQLDDRSLVNARLALSDVALGDGSLVVALWGQNLTDEEYRINTIPFGGRDQRVDPNGASGVGWTTSYFGDPRTYGLEVSYQF
ncbi:MAG: TonB-dependent receptor [Halioglobus sp.]|nr:TonB-dependent receptor [Halioglobus sp.]